MPHYKSSWPMLALTLAACALFISLGRWQWQRGEYRTAQWHSFEREDGIRDAAAADFAGLPRYTRVRLRGTLDGEHQFLLDNISEGGRAGYYVVTPLRFADGSAVLVNRGWIAGSGYREQLPQVALPAADEGTARSYTGRAGTLPAAGLESGRVPPAADGAWPRVASFPLESDLAAVLPYPLAGGVLLLDAQAPDTAASPLVRNWRPPGLAPAQHYSYAVQWWAFAALAVVLFLVLNLRKKNKKQTP